MIIKAAKRIGTGLTTAGLYPGHSKFSTNSISYLPSTDHRNNDFVPASEFSGDTRSLPNLDQNNLNNPQPPFKSEQLNLHSQLNQAYHENMPQSVEELNNIVDPIYDARDKAIQQYEKELDEDHTKIAKAIIERERYGEISSKDSHHMLRENTQIYKDQLKENRDAREEELMQSKQQYLIIKNQIENGQEINIHATGYISHAENSNASHTENRNTSDTDSPRSSLLDDYADTSTEMPDYIGGDD